MERAKRIVKATLGLAAAGAVAGGMAGMLFAGALESVPLPRYTPFVGRLVALAVGSAGLGTVLAPALAWLMLRRVPLGLAIGGPALGALAGGVGSLFWTPVLRPLPSMAADLLHAPALAAPLDTALVAMALAAPFVGLLAAAAGLRAVTPREARWTGLAGGDGSAPLTSGGKRMMFRKTRGPAGPPQTPDPARP